MDPNVSPIPSRNEEVMQENKLLRSLLLEATGAASLSGHQPSSLWQSTFCERQFRRDFQHSSINPGQRASSPVDITSLAQNSMYTDESESESTEIQSCQADPPREVTDPDRLLGEIAYQLDRRILFHVFQGHRRLYGFTVRNVPHKIVEVSTLQLTGKVDEGYRLHLTQRHAELMERLGKLGYKAALHPPFSELIINTFGILTARPGENSHQDYNNPGFLRRLIESKAPSRLQKDLLVLLTCLCSLAERDGKPLLLW